MTIDRLSEMHMNDFNRATENLLEWLDWEEWTPWLSGVHMEHAASMTDVGEHDISKLPADGAAMLNLFIFEDFLATRFGERDELNVISEYLKSNGWRESVLGRRYLEALRDSTASLYEVVDIDPGRSVTVRDLLVHGDAVTVHDRMGSQSMAQWDCLAGRVLVVNGQGRFAAGILHFGRDASARVISEIDRLVKMATRKLRRERRRTARRTRRRRGRSAALPPAEREAVVRAVPCAQVFTSCWLADAMDQIQAPLPDLRNTDDEAILFCEVRFPMIGSKARISAVLDGMERFERFEGGEARWRWWAPGSASRRFYQRKGVMQIDETEAGTGRTSLGNVEFGNGVMTLAANSMERAERGEALLSSRLGNLVGRALISSQDPLQGMKKGAAEPGRNETAPPTEEEVQAMHQFLDEHYLRTLDDPLPVLGGKTLRQAAATAEGRREAIDWIKGMENIEHRNATKEGRRAYDTRWIWKELGLKRPG